MSKPKILSTNYLHRGFFDVKQDVLEKEEGLTHPFTTLVLACSATSIIAQDEQGNYIINREYRHATGNYLLSLPGGRLEKGEDPLIGAQRELFEETGYFSNDLIKMGCSFPFPSICDQQIYFFWARNAVKKGNQKLDPFEFIHTELKTEEELEKEILQSDLVDSILLAAFAYKMLYSSRLNLNSL